MLEDGLVKRVAKVICALTLNFLH